ncbi:TetR/AcrR family transcriptional repressor of nem operon [Streptomyces sp. DSM 42143]|uniref:TetR/AcrR family transcriptional regulator n=1 Tax=Streptomyces prasinosporus TaxID=68256 RepID=A0ABP6U6C3_9ACTN|nr:MULTISPECIES: TetR/AcrR family transcriptional regulator [unclassified Streptomyces]MDN3250987.1 TetR/AcrR family transcriptional regulator [Streptomyces sp. ZSW22]MDN3258157.1 TetR/AcrR family transcriptional regulator [Streptomyces sp. MA25(2023)]MDQ0390093.1 TetR/AcrR family transcriptional repressor of nem operon [Streptomyces sp. DSM 42143]PAK22652.1 TetR family transcriptional regulator [Streptomyces sp. alain-838]
MARPRQFDEQNAVTAATELFWRRGYHATSVRDLGDELKLTPSSLYRTFTDKHTLFLRALDHYRATESTQARRRLDASDRPVREVLREWMLWLVACPADGESGRGCFVVNTATELGTTDAQVHERTEAAFSVTRQALHAVLAEGRERGELSTDLDIDGAVELLFTTVLGLRVRERAGHDLERLTTAIELAIRALGAAPAQPA